MAVCSLKFLFIASWLIFNLFICNTAVNFLPCLCSCRNLIKLDLSYNVIRELSGLKKLHVPAFSLKSLYLHGNQLSSLDHVINCLSGCRKLKELTMSQYGEANPVCEISAYQSSILTAIRSLEVLDGLDRTGKAAATRDDVFTIPGKILSYSFSNY